VQVLFLGTSLTEGLGLDRPGEEAWPARVAVLADSAGIPIAVTNAGIGGDTSAGTLSRLEWVMRQEPDILVVETGANDGLRGLPVDQLEANLDEIIRWVHAEYPDVQVLLSQMEAPPSLGADYTAGFRAVYRQVADRQLVELIPFLLEGVATIPELNQRDGIHPTPEGHWLMARNAWPTLEPSFRAALR
jgi:acyl-CoA thioesterase-1